MSKWIDVVLASDCITCPDCGEPWCLNCEQHYADCTCPGPHQDDMYDYRTYRGRLQARLKPEENE